MQFVSGRRFINWVRTGRLLQLPLRTWFMTFSGTIVIFSCIVIHQTRKVFYSEENIAESGPFVPYPKRIKWRTFPSWKQFSKMLCYCWSISQGKAANTNNIVRINPLQQLSEALKTFQAEGCDGGVLGLSCSDGRIFLFDMKKSGVNILRKADALASAYFL